MVNFGALRNLQYQSEYVNYNMGGKIVKRDESESVITTAERVEVIEIELGRSRHHHCPSRFSARVWASTGRRGSSTPPTTTRGHDAPLEEHRHRNPAPRREGIQYTPPRRSSLPPRQHLFNNVDHG